MILILSTHEDVCATLLAEECRARRVPVWHLHEDDVLSRLTFGWRPGDAAGSFLEVDGCRARMSEVRGVFARAPAPVATDPDLTEKDRRYAAFEMEAVLLGMLNALPGRVVNRPVPGRFFRPMFRLRENIEAVSAAGFALPEVLYATSVERAVVTLREWDGEAWASAVTGDPPQPVPPGEAGETWLQGQFADATVCLTRRPHGMAVDAFVVGGEVAAGLSNGDQISPTELDQPLLASCAGLCARLGLEFAHLQLSMSADRCTLMDINAYPDPSKCEAGMKGEVVSKLANLLGGAD